jgi:hypothetical protein
MTSVEHQSANLRLKVATIHTNIVGSFIEWGGEAWQEKRHAVQVVWWNPLTWGGSEWRQEGAPTLTNVSFFRGNGQEIPATVLNPQVVHADGYAKESCVYTFASIGTGSGPADLGNDARSVAQVKLTYTWQGATHELSDP